MPARRATRRFAWGVGPVCVMGLGLPSVAWAVTVPSDGYPTIQSVVDEARAGGTVYVEVTAGTTPDLVPVEVDGRSLVLTSGTPGVPYTLFGLIVGSSGHVEVTDADLRGDVGSNSSTGSGGLHAAVYVGWAGTLILTDSTLVDQGDGALYGIYSLSSTSIQLNGTTVSGFDGGGIHASAGELRIESSTFSNLGATAIVLDGRDNHLTLEVVGGTFSGNTGSYGADLALVGVAAVTLDGTQFESGGAKSGGSIYAYASPISGQDLSFRGAEAAGIGGTGGLGGAICAVDSDVACTGCRFEENAAALDGGALYVTGGSLSCDGSEFFANEAGSGGALSLVGSELSCTGATFTENVSRASGAAIRADSSRLVLDGSAFVGQSAGGTAAILQQVAVTNSVDRPLLTCVGCFFEGNSAGAIASVLAFSGVEGAGVSFDTTTFNLVGGGDLLPELAVGSADLSISGSVVTGSGLSGAFLVQEGGTLSVEDSAFAGLRVAFSPAAGAGLIHTRGVELVEMTRVLFCGVRSPGAALFLDDTDSELSNLVFYNNRLGALVSATGGSLDLQHVTSLGTVLPQTMDDALVRAEDSRVTLLNNLFTDRAAFGLAGMGNTIEMSGYNLWSRVGAAAAPEVQGYVGTGDILGLRPRFTSISPGLCPTTPDSLPWLSWASAAVSAGAPESANPDGLGPADLGALGGPGSSTWWEDYRDADADGYASRLDCDDQRADVRPGAALVEGIDADCDGAIEYFDDDADGFDEGDGDCDDAAASVFPGGVELPNGVDDNCDGVVDEGVVFDEDGDGSVNTEDCDDGDPAVHPGATDTPDNSVDEDCSGFAATFLVGGPGCACDGGGARPASFLLLGLGGLFLRRRR